MPGFSSEDLGNFFAYNRGFLGSHSDREHDLTTVTEDDAGVR